MYFLGPGDQLQYLLQLRAFGLWSDRVTQEDPLEVGTYQRKENLRLGLI